MATEFQMPKLGLTMEAGTILEWLVPSSTEVSPGTAVLLIETDKVESEVEVAEAARRSAQFRSRQVTDVHDKTEDLIAASSTTSAKWVRPTTAVC